MAAMGPRIPRKLKRRSRGLRREAPIPERIVWGFLRDRQLGGLKFRRQHPVGPYIVDFCCPDIRLIVELDGLSHVGQAERDEIRTKYLEGLGYRVVRATDDDVLQAREAVAQMIARAAGLNW